MPVHTINPPKRKKPNHTVINNPSRVIETVFVSSGMDELPFVRQKTKKGKNAVIASRAVVDPFYGIRNQSNRNGSLSIMGRKAEQMVKRLVADQVIVYSESSTTALRKMMRERIKVKRMRINFPYPYHYHHGERRMPARNYLRDLIKTAPHVLLPNGKVYIRSEHEPFLNDLQQQAKEAGWKVSNIYEYPSDVPVDYHGSDVAPYLEQNVKHGPTMGMGRRWKGSQQLKVFELTLTNGLKRAIPNKEKRRKFSQK